MQCLSKKGMKSLSGTQQTCWEMISLLGNNIWPQDECAGQFWLAEGTEDSTHPWLAWDAVLSLHGPAWGTGESPKRL